MMATSNGMTQTASPSAGPGPARSRWGKHPLRARWAFVGFLGVRAIVRWLPLPVAQALGRLVGALAYALARRYRGLTWTNLRQAFGPAMSDRIRHRIARRVFVNLGKNLMEWLVLDRLSPAQIQRLVEIQGINHLRRALARGKGVIALSAHFGNWELLPMALAAHGFQGGVLARPLRYPEYQAFLWGMRQRKGVRTFARGSLKDVAAVLRANQIVGMMPDQDMDSLEGVFVDFFDRPAYTPVGPAALALLTGAAILPCFILRDGRRFRVVIEEPIPIPHRGDRTREVQDITQAWSRVVESYLRRSPDHWVWMHQRWKTQPTQATRNKQQATSESEKAYRHAPAPKIHPQPALTSMLCAVCCVLCAALWGCAKSGPPSSTPAVASSSESTVAQEMDSFTVVGYAPDGAKRWELVGTGASLDGTIVTIQRPDAIGYDPQRKVYLTASVAQVEQTSRRIRLEHDVTIHTEDGLWLSSPMLYWLPDREELASEHPVRLETERMLLYGRGMAGHTKLNRVVVERDIELVLNQTSDPSASPRPEEGSGAAQASEPHGASHVTITCDGPLSFDYDHHIAVFERNVHVKDRQGDLYSDKLVAYISQTTRTIRYAEATGRVRIVQGGHLARSSRAVYEPAHSIVTLLGAPSLVIARESDGPAPSLASSFSMPFGGGPPASSELPAATAASTSPPAVASSDPPTSGP